MIQPAPFTQSSAAPVLVTGGAGYFGSRLVESLVARGRRCRIFDLHVPSRVPHGVEVHVGDVRDEQAVYRACVGVEQVHHTIAQVPLAKDRDLFDSVNRGGTEKLLRACAEAGVRKVIYTSSSAVLGVPERNPVTEDAAPKPMEAYGRAKFEGEQLCRHYVAKGLDVTIIRPRTILGHGRLGIFQILFEWIREGANVPVLGAGTNRYQFVHAEDLVDACLRAAERSGPGLYHCGARDFGTMRESLEALCRHAGTGSKVRSVPMRLAEWGMRWSGAMGISPLGAYHALMYGRSLWFDCERARRELGWEPRHSNESMLIESYEWYLKHRDEVLAGVEGSPHRRGVRQGVLSWVKRCL